MPLLSTFNLLRSLLRLRRLVFGEASVSAKLGVALLEPVRARQLQKLLQMFEQTISQRLGHLFRITVGATKWLWHDLVHQTQGQKVLGRDLERLGCFCGRRAVFPQDGSAAFRAD